MVTRSCQYESGCDGEMFLKGNFAEEGRLWRFLKVSRRESPELRGRRQGNLVNFLLFTCEQSLKRVEAGIEKDNPLKAHFGILFRDC